MASVLFSTNNKIKNILVKKKKKAIINKKKLWSDVKFNVKSR
jgi:hypothetical protein